jgi:hypothetical protein
LDENFFPADHVSHGDARAPPLTRSVTLMLAHQGVDLKRRPPKSRPDRAAGPKQAPAVDHGPQGLRRPRFSFFRFTCQTARNPERSPLPSIKRKEPPKSHTSDGAGCCSPSGSVRGFADTPSRSGGAPRRVI